MVMNKVTQRVISRSRRGRIEFHEGFSCPLLLRASVCFFTDDLACVSQSINHRPTPLTTKPPHAASGTAQLSIVGVWSS